MADPFRGRFKIVAAMVLAFVMAVPVSVLVGTAKVAEAAPAQTSLRIGFMQRIDSLNPFVGVDDASYVFYGLVYDGLSAIDNKMNSSPDLALSTWAVPASDSELVANHEPYGAVWQYNLTHDATWTDGEPFTADDVVFNINMNAWNYTTMWAYQPYSYWMAHADKVDQYTVRIHFYNKATGLPTPAAYGYLISIPMLPKHLIESMGPAYLNLNWSGVFPSLPVPIVGTGPFMTTSSIYSDWVNGNSITLVRNPDSHWQKQYNKTVHFDKIEMVFYDDATAMSLALQNGDIDVASFPPQTFLQLQQDVASGNLENIVTYNGPKITQYWTEVGFNMNYAGGNLVRLDPAVRRAMAMATDKNFICQQFYLGMATPGSTLIPPINSYWHYNLTDAEKIPLNYTLAATTLENAGYVWNTAHTVRVASASSLAVKNGWVYEGAPLTFGILVRQDHPEELQTAEYLQTQWVNIGVQVNIDIVGEPTINTIVYKYQYDLMIWYWSADIDPNYQLFVETSMAINGWSDNHYSSPAYDQNYTNSVMTMDRTQRKVYVDNCQRINYEDAPYIVLAYENQTYAWRTDTFTGWGDWATDPGRSIDNYWMGNPLYFDLVPTNISASSRFSIIDLPDKHISLDVPIGWSSQRNYTEVGVTYDLWIEGPVTSGYRPVGSLLIGPWPGAITDDTLYAEMANAIGVVRTTYGTSNVQVVSAPTNTTINGDYASEATMLITSSVATIAERVVIVASAAWHQEYALSLAVVQSQWSAYSGTFSTIVNSVTIAKNENGIGALWVLVMVGAAAAVVVAAVAVALLAVMAKKKAVALLPPQATQPDQSPFGMRGFCPHCGSQTAPGTAFCSSCGARLP